MVGAMGSGTTLLRLILDSHERIAVPRETGFMRAQLAHRFIPFKWSGKNWYKRLGWSDEEFDALQRDFYDTVFRRYVEKHGKQRWGEKTPLHTWHIDDMARVFPDAVFIGIVRHPGGSIASNMTRWDDTLRRARHHYWRYNTEIVRQAANHRDRFVLMRYEELVLQPEPVMRELLDWLGEPWDDTVLEHHTVQATRAGTMKVEGRNKRDDPIDASRISKWTERLDDRAKDVIRRDLSRLGEFFGYTMDDPLKFAPLRQDGGLLVGGADVDARIEQFPDLDLRTQPPVPLTDRIFHPRDIAPTLVEAPEDSPAAEEGTLMAIRSSKPLRRTLRPLVRRLPPGARQRLSAVARRMDGSGSGTPARRA
jgi:hypothetical protein